MRSDRVDVEPRAVHKEAAGLGRLEDVVAGVEIDGAKAKLMKNVILDHLDGHLRAAEMIVADQAPEFGLNPKYPLPRSFAHFWFLLVRTKKSGDRYCGVSVL